ncbi:MAG: DNA recombination protein RmuC [Alphaproteobacteria bacterium]|nr:DNA recombination protein RmuC [Alphaproteobacteria bacterium]
MNFPIEWVACGLGGIVVGFVIATLLQSFNRKRLSEQFKALSNEALTQNLDVLLNLAKNELSHERENTRADWEKRTSSVAEMLKPLEMRLTQLHTQTGEMEKARIGAYEGLKQHLSQMSETQTQLRFETIQLKQALRKPEGRGRWGEMQLKRVLEMSGMISHCDFTEQTNTTTQDNKRLRPDVIVHLPGNRQIVIDCKTPLEALLDATSAEPEQILLTHQRHARHLRDHVKSLSQKAYWDQFDETPDFVVMFVPGEHFLSIALQNDPELFDFAFSNKVILATPINLIGLLKTIAHAWRQEKLADQAQKIAGLGKDLYEAMASFATHFENIGDNLRKTVEHYNRSVGSFESRVFSRARRLADEYSIDSDKKIDVLETVDIAPRQLTITEDDVFAPQIPNKKQEVA